MSKNDLSYPFITSQYTKVIGQGIYITGADGFLQLKIEKI